MKNKLICDAEKESLEIEETIRKLKLKKIELDGLIYDSRADFRSRRNAAFAASLERIKNGETMESVGRGLGVTGASVSGRAVRLYRYIAVKNGLPSRDAGSGLRQMLCENWELINDFMERNPFWWEHVK